MPKRSECLNIKLFNGNTLPGSRIKNLVSHVEIATIFSDNITTCGIAVQGIYKLVDDDA